MSVSNAGAPGETLPSSVVPAESKTVIRWRGPRFGLTFWLCVVWLIVLATTAIGAGWLPLPDPLETDFLHRRVAPNGDFWLGTDQLGRDTLSRIIFGARVSLSIALAASLLSAFFGVIFGLPAGYFRGRLEAGVVGATDIVLAFPPIILVLLVAAYGGASLTNLVLVLGFLGIPSYTRIARATTLNFAQRDFVTAARVIGASHFRIMVRELLPNLLPPISAIVVLRHVADYRHRRHSLVSRLEPSAARAYLGQHDRGWRQRARLPPGHQLCPCWRHVHHYPRAECH